jgi:hypothetical protein
MIIGMTHIDFTNWMMRLGLRVRDAEALLGRSAATIKRYRAGTSAVPKPVAELCRRLEQERRS